MCSIFNALSFLLILFYSKIELVLVAKSAHFQFYNDLSFISVKTHCVMQHARFSYSMFVLS